MITNASDIHGEVVHILCPSLNWRIERNACGFHLFNQFGYCGTFSTLAEAIQADRDSGVEPSL